MRRVTNRLTEHFSYLQPSMENLADISEPQDLPKEQKINKLNFQSLYSAGRKTISPIQTE